MSKTTKVAMLVGAILSMCMVPVYAQAGDSEPPPFGEFLELLSGPLVAIAAAIAISVVVEYVRQYQALAPKWKTVVYYGICLVISLGAAALRGVLGYAEWTFDPLFWRAIWYAFAAGGVGTVTHQFIKKKG